MNLLTSTRPIQPHTPSIAGHAIVIANAVRVWTDGKGKTHFEYGVVAATRDPQTCSHTGTWLGHGLRIIPKGQHRPVAYTWARSAMFHLCCGDCGAVLR